MRRLLGCCVRRTQRAQAAEQELEEKFGMFDELAHVTSLSQQELYGVFAKAQAVSGSSMDPPSEGTATSSSVC